MRQIMVRSEHCLGCKSCELACAIAHSDGKTLFSAIGESLPPQKRIFVETNGAQNLPLQCRQCSDTPCVLACMSGAMHIEPETGLVQLDEQKCVGCWMCVMVCSFGAIGDVPASHKAVKCDRCLGLDYVPACVAACPTKALEFSEVQEFAHSSRQSFLSQMKGV